MLIALPPVHWTWLVFGSSPESSSLKTLSGVLVVVHDVIECLVSIYCIVGVLVQVDGPKLLVVRAASYCIRACSVSGRVSIVAPETIPSLLWLLLLLRRGSRRLDLRV